MDGRVGWVDSQVVEDRGYVFTKNSQMASIGAIFTSTHHTRQLNPCQNSSANRMVNYSQPSAYQGEMEPFEDCPSTSGCLTSLKNKPQQKQPNTFQHQYLAK